MPFRLISVGASTARPPSAISCPCHPERSEAATTAKRCADALAKGEGNEALRVEFRKERTSKPQGANALWDLSKNVAIQCAQSNILQEKVWRVHTAPSRSSLGRDPSARLYWLARDDTTKITAIGKYLHKPVGATIGRPISTISLFPLHFSTNYSIMTSSIALQRSSL